MLFLIAGTIVFVGLTYLLADYLYLINPSKNFNQSKEILKQLCFIPIIIAINNVYNMYIISLFLTKNFNINGLISTSYIIEFLILIGLFWMSEIKYKELKIWRK